MQRSRFLRFSDDATAKAAGLSQHSDTLAEEEEEKGEMENRTEMKSEKSSRCASLLAVYEPKQFSDRFITVVLS